MTKRPDYEQVDDLVRAIRLKRTLATARETLQGILSRGHETIDAFLTEKGMSVVEDLPHPDDLTEEHKDIMFEGWCHTLRHMILEVLAIEEPTVRLLVAHGLQRVLQEMVVIGMGSQSNAQELQVQISNMMDAVGDA